MRSSSSSLAACALVAACASRPGASPGRSSGDSPEVTSVAATADAGAPQGCLHDATDLAPCAEECDRGIASSCDLLATRAERGDGVPRDLTRAVVLHERACELKEAAACVSAARMHAAGTGVPPSRAKQVELLGVACRLGDTLACAIPAKAYATGNGVTKDEQRARELWERACLGGDQVACEAIAEP